MSQERLTLTRGAFLKGAAAFLLGPIGYKGGERFLVPMVEQIQAWNKTYPDFMAFLEEHGDWLKHLNFGTSISPEFMERMNGGPVNPELVVETLALWDLKDVRFGMRASNYVDRDNKIYLDKYIKWLQAFARYNRQHPDSPFRLRLNYGPIKTFHHNEYHFSPYIINNIKMPPPFSVITADSEVGRICLDYVPQLLAKLDEGVGLELFTTYQPENEATTSFGDERYRYTMGQDYMVKQILSLHAIHPQARILLNTGVTATGVQDVTDNPSPLEAIINMGEEAMAIEVNDARIRGQSPSLSITIGIDQYSKYDGFPPLQLPDVIHAKEKVIQPDTFSGYSMLKGGLHLGIQRQRLKQLGMIREITEIQIGPGEWAKFPTVYMPGAPEHFQYQLLRAKEMWIGDEKPAEPFHISCWEEIEKAVVMYIQGRSEMPEVLLMINAIRALKHLT